MKKIFFVMALLIVASRVLTACAGGWNPAPLNPNMNTNGPVTSQCPPEIGEGQCSSLIGHFKVDDNCEYRTDTSHPEKIEFWSIREGILIDGKPLNANERYTFDYPGGSPDNFTCVLDFTGNGNVNFEIIKEIK